MGALFGGKSRGPSLAQKTQDYYAQVQQARNQFAQQSSFQPAPAVTQSVASQVQATQVTPTIEDPNKLKLSAGGFFGASGAGFLSGKNSRKTFLGG